MKTLRRGTVVVVCSLLTAVLFSSAAQAPAQTQSAPSAFAKDRLFLPAFEFDGEIVPGQWWEGNLVYTDGDPVDALTLQVLAALQPFENFEVGGRVGFGSTDTPSSFPDGSGATDLDVWGKWRAGTSSPDTDVSVGGKLTIPTGDDTAGLGTDAFALTLFGALRQQMQNSVFTAYAGIQFNDNGQYLGTKIKGQTAGVMGAGVFVPLTNAITFVGEADLATERFEGGDSDFRIRGGINWHVSPRGVFRAALEIGITDGAPDGQLFLGYARIF